ncbi:unnamed protein product [Trichogramma brassicae]|uniref:Protein kinase domain-containing protein n=1 Tax=Trichogramma brassicae TaxID=86971 RepID=A0A6H5IJD9_9HYME|nr:unnamed protein product [Trichogramma brassicae]
MAVPMGPLDEGSVGHTDSSRTSFRGLRGGTGEEVNYHLTQLLTGHGFASDHHLVGLTTTRVTGAPACPLAVERCRACSFSTALDSRRKEGWLHRLSRGPLEPETLVHERRNFGLSNIYNDENPMRTQCGSPEYAAPELFVKNYKYGPEVDLWSLGVILYVMKRKNKISCLGCHTTEDQTYRDEIRERVAKASNFAKIWRFQLKVTPFIQIEQIKCAKFATAEVVFISYPNYILKHEKNESFTKSRIYTLTL